MLRCDGADHAVRWRSGERLNHLFEHTCDRLLAAGHSEHIAVSTATEDLTFSDLDRRANRLAHYFIANGLGPTRCVALLLDKSSDAYVALLAVAKTGATFVPLDASFPPDRVAYIAEDAGATHVLTVADYQSRFDAVERPRFVLETVVAEASSPLSTSA
ncbi:MAG: amino acid adenylation domain-containing protein [Verrucomicrobiae bacterium]|nr:amino acid adenylation domain-containing protein [Verrucomicrobiae bacterium]